MTITDRGAADARGPEGLRAGPAHAGDEARAAWERGPALSSDERHHYEFEGGGAASERQGRKRPGWFARLFR
jgi:hypothetical protein